MQLSKLLKMSKILPSLQFFFVYLYFRGLIKKLIYFILFYFRSLASITSMARNRYGKRPLQSWKTVTPHFLITFSYLIFTFVRLVFWGFALKGEEVGNFELITLLQQWEPHFYTAKVNFGLLNSVIVFGLSFEMLFAAYLHYLMEFKVHQISATLLMTDLYILNADNFIQLNYEILFEGVFSLQKIFSNLKRAWFGNHQDLLKLKHPILPHYPGISRKRRIQAALIASTAELLVATFIIPSIGKTTLKRCFKHTKPVKSL